MGASTRVLSLVASKFTNRLSVTIHPEPTTKNPALERPWRCGKNPSAVPFWENWSAKHASERFCGLNEVQSSCAPVADWHILQNAKVGHRHDQLQSVLALY